MKFVNISLQFSLSSANQRDEVSSFSKSVPHTETEKTVEPEQSNQEMIIESISYQRNNYNVGSVVEWSKRRAHDQHGLGSKPTRAILLCPWERHFTAHSPA